MLALSATAWAQLAVTLILGAITAYVGLSVRLKARQEVATNVAEKRFAAYGALWAATVVAAPTRALTNEPPFTPEQLLRLFRALTAWYYKDGNGMLLAKGTRNVYLAAKKNLICDPDEFVPESLRPEIRESPAARTDASIRQLSLLRTAMRGDIGIYAGPWGHDLDDDDRAFLVACGLDPDREPWRIRSRAERLRDLGRRERPAPPPAAAVPTRDA